MLAWWPGVIKPGVSSTVVSTLDIYQTFLELGQGHLADDHRTMDGFTVTNILNGDLEANTKHNIVPFFCGEKLIAVRYKEFKIYFYEQYDLNSSTLTRSCQNGSPLRDYYIDWKCLKARELKAPMIYNVEKDPAEKHILIGYEHILGDLVPLIEDLLTSLNDSRGKIQLFSTKYLSKSLIPCCNPPYCVCW